MKRIFYRPPYLFVSTGEILKKLLEDPTKRHFRIINYNLLKDRKSINEVVDKLSIKVIIIEMSEVKLYDETTIQQLIDFRIRGGIIYEATQFYEIINKRIPIIRLNEKEYLGDGIFSIKMRKRYKLLKRFFDIMFVICLAPIALPLILIGGLLTFCTSKGNVFFSQLRIGEYGKPFTIYKIRSMTSIDNHGGFTQSNDSRITSVGKILRLTKIDELPQLWNILIGNMSVIGPRPERPEYVHKYSEINPFFNLRHMIKPGVSGWAQIHIPRATPEDNLKKLEYDLFYIKRYSWILDVQILWKTLKIVLKLDSN